jgi:hypothetical protein
MEDGYIFRVLPHLVIHGHTMNITHLLIHLNKCPSVRPLAPPARPQLLGRVRAWDSDLLSGSCSVAPLGV